MGMFYVVHVLVHVHVHVHAHVHAHVSHNHSDTVNTLKAYHTPPTQKVR